MTKAEKCKKWREDNPDHKERKNAARNLKYWEEPEYRKAELRKMSLRLYKWTPEIYAAKLEEQGGHCALCEKVAGKKSLHVDHDHNCCGDDKKFTCGKCNRGILCQSCNTRIGYLEGFIRDGVIGVPKVSNWTSLALQYLKHYENLKYIVIVPVWNIPSNHPLAQTLYPSKTQETQ